MLRRENVLFEIEQETTTLKLYSRKRRADGDLQTFVRGFPLTATENNFRSPDPIASPPHQTEILDLPII